MIDTIREQLDRTDDLLELVSVALRGVDEEITALRLETCRRRLLNVRNILAAELRDLELDAGCGVLVHVQRADYLRRAAPPRKGKSP